MECEPRRIRFEPELSIRTFEPFFIHGSNRIGNRIHRERIQIAVIYAYRAAGHPVRIGIHDFGIVGTSYVLARDESRGVRQIKSDENDDHPRRHHTCECPHASVFPDFIRKEYESSHQSNEEHVAVKPRQREPVGYLVHRQARERAPDDEPYLKCQSYAEIPGIFVQRPVFQKRLASNKENDEKRNHRRNGEFPIPLLRVLRVRESFRTDGAISAECVFKLQQSESKKHEVCDREGNIRFPRSEIARTFRNRRVQIGAADFGNVRVEESSENDGDDHYPENPHQVYVGERRALKRRYPSYDTSERSAENEVS